MKRVLICGSRDWHDRQAIRERLIDLIMTYGAGSLLVIHGGAKGADVMAGTEARHQGIHVAEIKALWGEFGNSAGPLRNRAMLALGPDLVLAFHRAESRGTADMIDAARGAGVEVLVVRG